MHDNLIDKSPKGNGGEPMWIVLHNATGAQRRRWGPDMVALVSDLVDRYGWVMWREGADAHVKHRSLMVN